MASNYTGLGVQLMTTGEKAGTWGTLTNTNWDIMEQISGGYIAQDIAGGAGTTTLSVSDGSTGATLAHRIIEFTGAITGNRIVTIPLDVQTFYILKNTTTDGSDAYTVQFKYVTGSGGSVTFAGGDRGTKIVYATANDGTNPDIVDATSAFVTATSTTTLSNKTLTEPKFVSGGFIADANGAEMLVFDTVASALNEVKITNAATGTAGPIIASQGQTNSNLQLRPAGSGMITVGTTAANAFISSNGAHNLILQTNEGTDSGTITITDAADGNIALAPNGTGEVVVGSGSAAGDITTSGTHDLILDTNAGTNSGNITITDGVNGNITLSPNGTGEVQAVDAADATGAVKIAGTETMWVPATAMYAETTNGAELAQTVLTAGAPELKAFAFDASTAEAVQFNVCFPKSWNASTVTFQTFWSASSTNTGTGGFTLAGCSVANNVDYDLAFGSAVANTALAASGTQDDLMVNVVSGAVTIASAADSTNTIFRLVRDTGTDTNTGDLRLVGVKIFYTTDAANDA